LALGTQAQTSEITGNYAQLATVSSDGHQNAQKDDGQTNPKPQQIQ
jgi:hypothetical protein